MRFKLDIGQTLVEYIVALLIILSCNSVFLYSIDKNYYIPQLIIIFTVILSCILSFNLKINKKAFINLVIVTIIYITYTFSFTLINSFHTSKSNFIIRFIIFIPLMIYCFFIYQQKNNTYKIFYRISDVVLILTIISLFFWIFSSLINQIRPTGYTYIYWGSAHNITNYYNVYFETQDIKFLNFEFIRNSGIFCEAPMYSLCLVITLTIELFLKVKVNLKTCLLILSGIITTFSTTGFISAIIIIIAKIFILKNKKLNSYKFIRVIKPIFMLSFIILSIYSIVLLLNIKQETNSYSIRLDDFVIGYKSWIEAPILGNGYGSIDSIKKYMDTWIRSNTGFSNGIMAVLSQGGLMLTLLYISPFIYILKKSFKFNKWNIFWTLAIVLELFITTFWQDTFLLFIFIAFGYSLFIYNNIILKKE
ncbi:hypothetical protein DVW12_15055 [Clostridium botulinum]|nr:hypothetical protein [Clostridium botulinum]